MQSSIPPTISKGEYMKEEIAKVIANALKDMLGGEEEFIDEDLYREIGRDSNESK